MWDRPPLSSYPKNITVATPCEPLLSAVSQEWFPHSISFTAGLSPEGQPSALIPCWTQGVSERRRAGTGPSASPVWSSAVTGGLDAAAHGARPPRREGPTSLAAVSTFSGTEKVEPECSPSGRGRTSPVGGRCGSQLRARGHDLLEVSTRSVRL